ncbi:hypothetical protein PZ938_13165 [Luteipulveratus sp. YIM 133132]|uniref:HTH cro/C1-type domain-containing protein n=1 Tax=Luteipulveratus flavus TaxID=3031728 RepID=A0ABT6C5A5_9MICO|nr:MULTISPECIES: hypothetical protein [unclassified Luteipulveratus]MDE9366556.1 hypothetical protein [Luteipulveratus sp. YIM 133132]MDF8263507.1 hypothetical protein [Luteipulveratus sp. YIM 133296]
MTTMTALSLQQQQLLAQAQISRALEDVARLDTQRAMLAAIAAGVRQQTLADTLGVSQGAVSQRLKVARDAAPVPEGFVGASPREIAQRYAVRMIDRPTMLQQLADWPYPPRDHSRANEEWNYVADAHPWDDVTDARRRGWITDEDYDAILDRRGYSR